MKKSLLYVYALYALMPSFNLYSISIKKPWTILIYIAGDNDLEVFIDSNIDGMTKTGSNENCNIIACVSRREGNKRTKTLKYILIENQQHKILFETTLPSLVDSGHEETLRNFCKYAITEFPASHYGLIFWNHGLGPLSPARSYSYRTKDIFRFNFSCPAYSPSLLPALKLILKPTPLTKTVCFDDTTGNYLTEKKITTVLKEIYNTILEKQKFALVGFDTCLMAHVEIASFLKQHADYMVASQDNEPGTGWDYEKIFSIFNDTIPTPAQFGQHIVESYKNYYQSTDDITLSCVDLEKYHRVENEIKNFIQLLQMTHIEYPNFPLKLLLKASAHKKNCTHFDEPEYIDIVHFLENFLYNFQKASIKKECPLNNLVKEKIKISILKTITIIHEAIIANTASKNYTKATGLSIYFPTYAVDKLYKKNIFCCATAWAQLLQNCL